MLKSESLSNVFAAFVAAQSELPSITRTKTVKVNTRTGGSYNFKYAPLDTVIDTVKPIYAKHGLSVTQLLSVNGIETFVIHESGEYFGSTFPIEEYLYKTVKNVVDGKTVLDREPIGPQELGSIVTYLKRYAYGAINHLALDDDDDANGPSGNKVEEQPQSVKPTVKPPTKAPSKPAEKPVAKEEPKAETPAPAAEESPFEADETGNGWSAEPWDEVYETKLYEHLSSFGTIPEIMKEVQAIMKDVQSVHNAAKKEEWRVKFQPVVIKIGQERANQ